MPDVSEETTDPIAGLEPEAGTAPPRLFAVRGATQVPENTAAAIEAGTEELLREILTRNGIDEATMVSCLFTTTEDLDAQFPAVAAQIGRAHV